MRLKQLKLKIYEMIFENDSPHWIALSFSIGLFFGFIPLLWLQLIPLLLVMFLFKLNKAATLIGHFILNTFTFPLVYAFSFIVGTRILGEDVGTLFNARALSWSYLAEIYKPLFVGCMVVGVISSVLAYFVVKYLVKAYRPRYDADKQGGERVGKQASKQADNQSDNQDGRLQVKKSKGRKKKREK